VRDLPRIALRNVVRRPRRTVVVLGAVALGVVVMTVAAGVLDFTLRGFAGSIVYGGIGHLQIGPAADDPTGRIAPAVAAELRRALAEDPRIEVYGARLELQALVSSGRATVAASAIGVEAAAEARIRALTMLRVGAWFSGRERTARAVLGRGLAERLGVGVRDPVSIVAYSDAGRMTAADLEVAGIFESGVIEYDARTLLLPIAVAAELAETAGVSNVAVVLRDATAERAVSADLARNEVRVVGWRDLAPVYGRVAALYRWILRLFLLMVAIVVVLGIANTTTMAVLERGPEVGLLRALGLGPGRILAMLVLEATIVGVVGALGGVLLAGLACHALTELEVAMPPPPGRSQGYLLEVPMVARAALGAAAVALSSAILACVMPSLRALGGEVSDVLRVR